MIYVPATVNPVTVHKSVLVPVPFGDGLVELVRLDEYELNPVGARIKVLILLNPFYIVFASS